MKFIKEALLNDSHTIIINDPGKIDIMKTISINSMIKIAAEAEDREKILFELKKNTKTLQKMNYSSREYLHHKKQNKRNASVLSKETLAFYI